LAYLDLSTPLIHNIYFSILIYLLSRMSGPGSKQTTAFYD